MTLVCGQLPAAPFEPSSQTHFRPIGRLVDSLAGSAIRGPWIGSLALNPTLRNRVLDNVGLVEAPKPVTMTSLGTDQVYVLPDVVMPPC